MIIKIDVREAELIQSIQFLLTTNTSFQELTIVNEQLPLGDVIICDEKEEKVIIERKTLKDLSSSIKDGRYEEQSYRLSGIDHPNHNIIYLVEGSMDKFNVFKGRGDKMTLYSAMISLNYFKGFSVMRSLSVEESALIICNCALKIMKSEHQGKTAFYKKVVAQPASPAENELEPNVAEEPVVEPVAEAASVPYCSVVKKIKKDNITPENIGEIMLCQIPGISSVTAVAVMEHYKTIPNLIAAIRADPSCLQTVSYKTGAGQTRKINKTCVSNVLSFLK